MKRKAAFALLTVIGVIEVSVLCWVGGSVILPVLFNQHPCYDPRFQPPTAPTTTLPADLILEPITVNNAARIIQLDLEDSQETLSWDRPWGIDGSVILTGDGVSSERRSTNTFKGRNSNRAYLSVSSFTEYLAVVRSPNGLCTAIAYGHGRIKMHDLDGDLVRGSPLRRDLVPVGEWGWVVTIDFDATGRYLAYGTELPSSEDGPRLAAVWDLARTREIAHFEMAESVTSVGLSPDGRFLAVAEETGAITLWNVEQESHLAIFQGQERGIRRVLFDREGQLIASGSYDGEIRFWDTAATGQPDTVIQVIHLRNMAFSPDMRLLIITDWDGEVSYWGVPVEG